MENKKKVIIEPISVKLEVELNTTILKALENEGFSLNAVCGGKGTCGQCKIQISSNQMENVSPLSPAERKLLTDKEIEQGYRLGCQTQVKNDVRVYLTESFLLNNSKILHEASQEAKIYARYMKLPRFWKVQLDLEKFKKESQTTLSDFDLIKTAIRDQLPLLGIYNNYIETQYNCLKELSHVIREEKGSVTAILQTNINSEHEPIMLLKVQSGDTTEGLWGVAFDIGTTTIVGYLIDLNTGKVVDIESMLNPQTAIGEDVITRINYSAESTENFHKAQDLVHQAINQIIRRFEKAPLLNKKDIVEITVVGNTVMHHLFFGLPVNYLGLAPYPPVIQESIRLRNYHLNIDSMSIDSEIYSPPIIAGFVGADTMADIIALRLDQIKERTLLIDIGTNGELVLGSRSEGLMASSCAAGSAFEGAHIKNGMRGSEGAIEKILIDPEDFTPSINVIGATTPIGLCGSAIVDIVAEMLRAKILTRSGKFNMDYVKEKNPERFRKGKNGWEYIIHSKDFPADLNFKLKEGAKLFNGGEKDIVFTQDDVREIQKAKGAFLSGELLLMKKKKIQLPELDQIYICGAFGTFIHIDNAKFIGLIPDVDLEEVYQIGNAAGEGAKALILNTELREVANRVSKETEYFEIANDPKFQREYANSMIFPHNNLDLFPSLKDEYKDIPLR